MQDIIGCTAISDGPFLENSVEHYDRACAACEVHLVLNQATHALLVCLLFYDNTEKGSRGLALRHHPGLAELGLVAGMRVDPTACLPDVGLFFQLSVFPFQFFFGTSDARSTPGTALLCLTKSCRCRR